MCIYISHAVPQKGDIMASAILNQTFIMLILIFVGVLCAKTGLISQDANSSLSKFVLQVVNPAVIFMSYQKECESRLVKNLLLTFALSAVSFAAAIGMAYLLIRHKEGRDTEAERFSAIYSNCGFMGIPLVNAVFCSEGVFYLTAYITVFNIIVWTHGVIMISGQRDVNDLLKVFRSPTIISIVLGLVTFFAGIRLPGTVSKALEYITDLNTPLAMVVSGVTISSANIKKLLSNKRIYYIVSVKLVIIPAVISLLLIVTGICTPVTHTVLIASAAPPAAMCTLMCLKYGKNSVYASQIFALGTVLSAVTLPLLLKYTECLTKMIDSVCNIR